MIFLDKQPLKELGDYLTYDSKVSTLVFGKAAPIPEENIHSLSWTITCSIPQPEMLFGKSV